MNTELGVAAESALGGSFPIRVHLRSSAAEAPKIRVYPRVRLLRGRNGIGNGVFNRLQ